MRKLGIAVAGSALLIGIGTANAADMAVKARAIAVDPSYNWTGFYAGLNAGYGWQNSTGNLVANSGGLGIPGAIVAGTIPRSYGLAPEGGLGGGQIGYNWQTNHFVFGVEADLQASGIKKSIAIANPGGGGFFPTLSTASSELDWFGTVRGRLGYAWDKFLIYGTGGLAYGYTSDSASSQTVPPPPLATGTASGTRTGWTVGAGFEWAFYQSWSVKGEYLHVDLGSSVDRITFPSGDFIDYRFRHIYDIARVGVNYKFGGPAPAVVAKY